jgi:hypothetical protein
MGMCSVFAWADIAADVPPTPRRARDTAHHRTRRPAQPETGHVPPADGPVVAR